MATYKNTDNWWNEEQIKYANLKHRHNEGLPNLDASRVIMRLILKDEVDWDM
jgi:hypothetical protein